MGIPLGISSSRTRRRWYYRFKIPPSDPLPKWQNLFSRYPSLKDIHRYVGTYEYKLTFGSKEDAILAKLCFGY